MEYIVQTTNLTKRFGTKLAVNQVNMNIRKGEIYGLIGRNGAGKTTLMRVLNGLAYPTSGEIRLFDEPVNPDQGARIGSLIENPGLFKNCSARENLIRYAILYGADQSQVDNLLRIVGLDQTGKKKVGRFSLGMKQRLGIAIALLGSPELLILDEPVNGLDPAGIMDVRNLLLTLNKQLGITILISSHLLDELAKVVTWYGILNKGELVEEVSAEELKQRFGKRLVLTVDDPERAARILKAYYSAGNAKKASDETEKQEEPASPQRTEAAENSGTEIYSTTEETSDNAAAMWPDMPADDNKASELQLETNGNELILSEHLEDRVLINRILSAENIEVSGIEIRDESLEQYLVERMG